MMLLLVGLTIIRSVDLLTLSNLNKGDYKMEKFNAILEDLLTLTNVAIEELNCNHIESAKEFLEHIKEGIEINISK